MFLFFQLSCSRKVEFAEDAARRKDREDSAEDEVGSWLEEVGCIVLGVSAMVYTVEMQTYNSDHAIRL